MSAALHCQVNDLNVVKNGKGILRGICLDWPLHGLGMVLGPNGAGKSTLLRALAGLEDDAAAFVRYDGEPLAKISLARRAALIAFAPATALVPFAYRAVDVVVMGRFASHHGYPGAKDYRVAESYLDRMGLASLRHQIITRLSSGERQRVNIARALAAETPCLLLDEPAAHLDLAQAFHLLSLLHERTRRGHMVLMTHHDLHTVETYADHCTVLKEGRVLASGPTGEAFSPTVVAEAFGLRMGGSATGRVFHWQGQNAP